jgi:hypothetical protein
LSIIGERYGNLKIKVTFVKFGKKHFAECLFDKSCNVIEPVTSDASLVKEMAT